MAEQLVEQEVVRHDIIMIFSFIQKCIKPNAKDFKLVLLKSVLTTISY